MKEGLWFRGSLHVLGGWDLWTGLQLSVLSFGLSKTFQHKEASSLSAAVTVLKWDYWTTGTARSFHRSPSNILPWAEPSPTPDEGTYNLVQSHLKSLQAWRFDCLSGQPVPALHPAPGETVKSNLDLPNGKLLPLPTVSSAMVEKYLTLPYLCLSAGWLWPPPAHLSPA